MSAPAAPLEVVLSHHRYPIHFGRGLAPLIRTEVEALLSAKRPVAVVTDASVAHAQAAYLDAALGAAPRIILPPGEGTKGFEQLEEVCEFLATHRIDRSGVLFAVGGGVVGDLAGFAAASFLRGIDFHQVPTTLLAMVDSSVGGKTGINLRAGKNLVGAFHQPRAVFADAAVLETLPAREFAAGMGEVIKHGLLADRALFEELERLGPLHPQHPALPDIIRRNCAIKAGIVQADERETAASGGRALLNLGHTFGHAIEAVAGYGDYLHGEAVGVGLVLAGRLSAALGRITGGEAARIERVVAANGLPTRLREPLEVKRLLETMARDKKVKQGTLRFVILGALGAAETASGIDPELVARLWREAGAV